MKRTHLSPNPRSHPCPASTIPTFSLSSYFIFKKQVSKNKQKSTLYNIVWMLLLPPGSRALSREQSLNELLLFLGSLGLSPTARPCSPQFFRAKGLAKEPGNAAPSGEAGSALWRTVFWGRAPNQTPQYCPFFQLAEYLSATWKSHRKVGSWPGSCPRTWAKGLIWK